MAPRLPTITVAVEKAISQIEANKCPGALRTLQTLDNKLGKTTKKKAPTGYAKFVKENYKRFAKENPGVPMIKLTPKLAAAWKIKKGKA